MNEDKEILTAPPPPTDAIEDIDLFDENANPNLMSVEASRELLEDEMLRTYISVMRDRENRDRVKAASDVAEILGHKGRKATTTVIANNAQINQLPDDMRKHLLSAGDGLRQITSGSDAKIKIKGGGHGA